MPMDSCPPASAKLDPCAACRFLHRRCSFDCRLAPYFLANEPEKFASVHRVFGASNVIKMLQAVEESEREDSVKSMVYEAYSRLRDPIHGCTGAIFYLQRCVEDLKVQLQAIRAQVVESEEQRDYLMNMLMDAAQFNPFNSVMEDTMFDGGSLLLDDNTIHGDSGKIID